MKLIKTDFEGLIVIESTIFKDSRGFFFESYNKSRYREAGISMEFVQDNQSRSVQHVIRGLHFQADPHAQTKLVRVLQGAILDVVVDLRKSLATYKKVYSIELSDRNQLQLLIPKGFAHGFSVLSDSAEILYKCDDYYHAECERGIHFNDPELGIDWKVKPADALVSAKDAALPWLSEWQKNS